jgi:P-type Cu2+ transporter
MPRCDHCLLDFPEREAARDLVAGAARVFCCAGCRGVYALVHAEGLAAFYDRRTSEPGSSWEETGPGTVNAPRPDAALFREAVREVEGGQELDFAIEGIRCASCVWLNERVLGRTAGVLAARVNYATHRARVRFDPRTIALEAVLERVASVGYRPRPWSESDGARRREAEARDLLVRFGTAAFLSSQLMIYVAALYAGYFQGIDPGTRRLMEWISLALTVPVLTYAAAPFWRAAFAGARHGRASMDLLVVLGTGAAFAFSVFEMTRGGEVYFDTAAGIVTLILLGRYLEARAKGRASEAIARLAGLVPKDACVVDADGTRRAVAVAALVPGQRVEVLPGAQLPADGEVEEGVSDVDESLVTGESRPVAKGPGAAVIGGSVNQHGSLRVRLTRTGKDTVLAGIARAVEEAQARKPRVQAIADRVVGGFVPVVLAIAAGTVAFHLWRGASAADAVMAAISVLVIACPCALGLATPLAVLVASGVASARGILLKSGDVLETAARVTDVVLDKTGTLTRGAPSVLACFAVEPGVSADEVLALAAAVERRSEHVHARAIVEAARAGAGVADVEVGGFRAVPGRGVVAEVASVADGGSRVGGARTSTRTSYELRVTSTSTSTSASTSTSTSTSASASTSTTTSTDRGARLASADGGLRIESESATVKVLVGNRALLAEQGVAVPDGALARAAALEAEGNTVVWVARDRRVLGLVALADAVRPESPEVIAALRARGLGVAVVSGDAPGPTARVAATLGIERAEAEVTPEGKRAVVEAMQRDGRRVLFAGDGVNDAPVLSQADLGVAVARGADVSLESADAVLVRDDLRLVPDLVRLGRRATNVIRGNLFWAFAYNVAGIPLAVLGVLHPLVAAAAMAASSLFVVGNSLRIRGALGR